MESLNGKIDLLATDVVMPQMSGKELAQKIRRSYRGVRVLYLSGYAGNAIVHHGMLDPGVDFLQKPFSSRELLGKIREILQRRQADALRD